MGGVIGCHVSEFDLKQLQRGKFLKILASESHFERFSTHMAGQRASHCCDTSKQLSFPNHGSMVSFNTSQLFHDNSNGCWVALELAFIASAVVTRMRMHCYDHMAHGTSPLYTSVRSLRDLHSLGPSALGCVNSVETCTSVYNLYLAMHNSQLSSQYYYHTAGTHM